MYFPPKFKSAVLLIVNINAFFYLLTPSVRSPHPLFLVFFFCSVRATEGENPLMITYSDGRKTFSCSCSDPQNAVSASLLTDHQSGQLRWMKRRPRLTGDDYITANMRNSPGPCNRLGCGSQVLPQLVFLKPFLDFSQKRPCNYLLHLKSMMHWCIGAKRRGDMKKKGKFMETQDRSSSTVQPILWSSH